MSVHDEAGAATATLNAPAVILAAGARPRALPGLPFDGTRVISSTEAMLLQEVPGSLAIIGAGAVGVEFAYLYNAFGSRVTLIEMLPQVLPVEDREISAALQKSLTAQGIDVLVESRVDGAEPSGDGLQLQVATPQGARAVQADKVLVAIGVQGNVETLGLDAAGVSVEGGFVPVDAHCRTNVPGVYAIGDLNGQPCLAHVASAEGIAAVETIAGLDHPGGQLRQHPRLHLLPPAGRQRRPDGAGGAGRRPPHPRRAVPLCGQRQGPGGGRQRGHGEGHLRRRQR